MKGKPFVEAINMSLDFGIIFYPTLCPRGCQTWKITPMILADPSNGGRVCGPGSGVPSSCESRASAVVVGEENIHIKDPNPIPRSRVTGVGPVIL